MGYSAALKENLFPWCQTCWKEHRNIYSRSEALAPFWIGKNIKSRVFTSFWPILFFLESKTNTRGAKIQAPQMEDKAEQKEGSSLRDEVILRSYLPFSSCFASGVRILRANGNISPQMIALLKSGVPHRRRRTVWTSLLLCNVFAAKNPDCYLALSQMPIDPTLNRKIVIDLARTFPNHPFFDHEGYTHSTPLPG